MTTHQNDDGAKTGAKSGTSGAKSGAKGAQGAGQGSAATNTVRFEDNLAKIEALSARFVAAMGKGRSNVPALAGPGNDLYMHAATAYMAEMASNPAKLIEHQIGWWSKTVQNYVETQKSLTKTGNVPQSAPSKDRRFSNPLWESHPYFSFVKEQYFLNAEAMETAIGDIEGMDEREKNRLSYFSRQIIDMLAPSNFLASNPDALELAAATEGQSLVDGLENLVADLEAHNGDLVVTPADKDAFVVGQNLATSPGKVVFRNRLFELIQYAPTTDKVHSTPLIIFPPWINKFYILDLKDKNSLIKWITDQGFTLFVVSWVNPDASYRDTNMTNYVEEGLMTAISEVKAICGTKTVNAIGYCIAGTTLAMTLAVMKKRGDTSVASATFFTTMTDFSDQGEMGVFLEDDFLDGIEAEVMEHGVLDSYYLSKTFSYLRSNDLIYAPAIRSYMMGQAPPAFDLLYWNGDGTNLPAAMAIEYLRELCQGNKLADGGFAIAGEVATLADVTVPLCAIACETDHIAAWKSSYRGVQQMGSEDKTFILSQSGHIAGIVNPPSKNKYGHWTNEDLTAGPEDWQAAADMHEGSWWPRWGKWLAQHSGPMVKARNPEEGPNEVLADAPGTYVMAGNSI